MFSRSQSAFGHLDGWTVGPHRLTIPFSSKTLSFSGGYGLCTTTFVEAKKIRSNKRHLETTAWMEAKRADQHDYV